MNNLLRLIYMVLLTAAHACFSQEVITKINFTGNKKTKAWFLKRLIKTKETQTFDPKKTNLDIDRLERLDGIAHASHSIEKNEDGVVLTFLIEENFSIIPGLNIGQANDDSFAYRVSIFEFNALGQNIIFGGFYSKEVFDSFGIFLEHPYLLTNKLGLGINYQDLTTQEPIYFPSQQANYNYTQKGTEFLLFYEKDFNNQFEFGAKIFNEEYKIIENDEQNDGLENPIEPKADIFSVLGLYNYVNIDTEYHQFKGLRNSFFAQYFFNDSNVIQTEYIFSNTTSFFKRFGKNGNLATRFQLTLSNDFDDSYFAPIIIDNQLNIRGVGNTNSRGTSSYALNTEYRHTLIEKKWFVLQSNTFLDIGGLKGVDQKFSHIFNLSQTEIFPGIGIRLIHKKIFNAVLRIDYGFKLKGSENAQSSGIVFGIGQYF